MEYNFIVEQPVAYRMMKNAIKKGNAHAYLFHGPKGTHKLEMAIMFAQSLFCEHTKDGIACGSCDTCVRIQDGQFADMILVDGEKTSIKKEDILHIQKEFSTTALEKYGKKIYILNNCENSTAAAMNSLLKFLEEPEGDVLAILCTDQLERVLPTIVSRCQLVPFRLSDYQVIKKYGIENGLSELDAHLTSQLVSNVVEMENLVKQEEYQIALSLWMGFMNKCYEDVQGGMLYLMLEGFHAKTKYSNKEVLELFLNIGVIFTQDCLYQRKVESEDWTKLMNDFNKLNISSQKLLSILLSIKDRSLRNANVLLTVDQLGYLLIKEVS